MLDWGAFVQPLLLWKSNDHYIFWVCDCSLSYPACNARAPYCHLWPAPLCNIFPHYLINGTIFGGKKIVTEHKMCVFSLQFLSETFLILGRPQRDLVINVLWSSCEVPLLVSHFDETWIFLPRNIQITNFMKIRPVAAEMFHAGGQTDRHGAAKSRFSKLCERA